MGREAIKCLDCGVTVAPVDKWEQCGCGHLYVDASIDPPRVGFLSEESVQYADVFSETEQGEKLNTESRSQTRRKKVQKSGDKWAESGSFE